MANIDQMIADIEGLTVLELNQLVKALETRFGVSAAAPMVMTGAPAAGGATAGGAAPAAPVGEEQTEFDVILKAAGDKKIQVIKVVRQLTNLGLKEAKDLVDGAPQTVLSGVSKEAAAEARTKLEGEGAQVDVK